MLFGSSTFRHPWPHGPTPQQAPSLGSKWWGSTKAPLLWPCSHHPPGRGHRIWLLLADVGSPHVTVERRWEMVWGGEGRCGAAAGGRGSVGRGVDGAAVGEAGTLEGVWTRGWGRQEWATSGICAGEDGRGMRKCWRVGVQAEAPRGPRDAAARGLDAKAGAVWAGRRTEDGQAEVSNPMGTQLWSAPLLRCPRIPSPQTSCCSRSVSLNPLLSLQGAPQTSNMRSCQVTSL